jgi:hypothetical protein
MVVPRHTSVFPPSFYPDPDCVTLGLYCGSRPSTIVAIMCLLRLAATSLGLGMRRRRHQVVLMRHVRFWSPQYDLTMRPAAATVHKLES